MIRRNEEIECKERDISENHWRALQMEQIVCA